MTAGGVRPTPELDGAELDRMMGDLVQTLRGATLEPAEVASVQAAVLARAPSASGGGLSSALGSGALVKGALVLGLVVTAGVALPPAVPARTGSPPGFRSTHAPGAGDLPGAHAAGVPRGVVAGRPVIPAAVEPGEDKAGAATVARHATARATSGRDDAAVRETAGVGGPAGVEPGAKPPFAGEVQPHDVARSAQQLDDGTAPPADMVFEAPAPATDLPPSEDLARGLRAYAHGDYAAAARALVPVLEGQSQDGSANVHKAELFYARSLFHLGLYQSAALAFAAIAEQGPAHEHFDESLPWIAQLADHVPEPATVIDAVGHYRLQQIERLNTPETRDRYDELLYLLGRKRYAERELDQAIALFRRVRSGSRWFVPARFYEGISHIRDRHARPAIQAFRSVIDAVDEGEAGDLPDEDRMRDLAWISLARVYYTAANRHDERDRLVTSGRLLGNALAAWERVPVSSEHWLDSLFEQSWALFIAGEHERALGRIHALLSPYFVDRYYPEALVVKAVVYFEHCHLDDAEATVHDFHARYDDVLTDLRAVASRPTDTAGAFDLLTRIHAGSADVPPRVQGLVRESLTDRELQRHLDQVRSLSDEAHRVARLGSDALSARLGQELAVERALTVDTTGELVQHRLAHLVEHLQERMNEMDTVELEVQTMRRTSGPLAPADPDDGRIIADQEHQIWVFNGEYWRDEIPYYRQAIGDRCTR